MRNRSETFINSSISRRCQSAAYLESQRLEEPLVLAGQVSLFQGLLDLLLRIFPLADLLECVVVDDVLETLEFEGVTGRHDVVVVDLLDERLDLGALLNSLLAHAPGHFRGVALDAGHKSVGERVGLCAGVDRLDDNDLAKMLVLRSMSCRHSDALSDFAQHRRGRSRTFLPAYRPRVIMATRPTLRNFIVKLSCE
jgi:hypothetical protein